MKYYCYVLLLLITVLNQRVDAQPKGVYVLDNNKGIYRDANIRDYPFVDGFAWRTSWQEIETGKDIYDFAGIDHIVQRLDSIHKKLTILFGAYDVEPAYIASNPGVVTYPFTNPLSSVTTTRAVPYDAYLLQRFRLFVSTVANHQVYSIGTGKKVALKDHPVLANIATNIPGLGAIRNVNGTGTNIQSVLPGYTRNKFTDSLLVSMQVQTDNFPGKNVFIPFYKNINDSTNSPALSSYIRTQLLLHFNGLSHQKISFWQENLAGYTDTASKIFTGLPLTTFATPLYQLNDSAYTMFQMLQGWTTPFLDPAKTANSSPFDAMCYAYKTYQTSYFEVYVGDIDDTAYGKVFKSWDPVTECGGSSIIVSKVIENTPIGVYPNPVQSKLYFTGLTSTSGYDIIILDLQGREVLHVYGKGPIDVSQLEEGIYIARLNDDKGVHLAKFVKH